MGLGKYLAMVAAPLFGLGAAAAHAAPVGSAETVRPTDYFLGRWQVGAVDPATKVEDQLCYEVGKFVGDRWIAGFGWSADGKFQVRDVWGQDPLSGEVFRTVYDGGGTYAVVRSSGWAGDRLILEGDARSPGGVVRVRETITRIGPDQFNATWESRRDGEWSAYSIETVRRAAAGECVSGAKAGADL